MGLFIIMNYGVTYSVTYSVTYGVHSSPAP